MKQTDSNSYSKLEKDLYWKQYSTSVDTSWNKMYKNRLSLMQAWQDSSFSHSVSDTLSLFYPFSGPDFLHAYYLYPNTKEFMLFALEPIISIAALDSVSLKERDKFLDTLNHSLRDIFYKSYFITTHMQKDLKQVKGVLPPFYFFMERTGHELLEQKFISIDSAGDEKEVKGGKLYRQRVPGVKLVFRNIESRQIKTLYYFNVDLSDKGLKKKPEIMLFVKKRKVFNTFVKSASYLMHNTDFTMMRNLILNHSKSLFQDDTGLPYKSFKNRLDFTVSFYGAYTKPVSDFGSYTYQADLDSAYKRASDKKPLPFSLGYHWSSKIQNYMLITNSSPSVGVEIGEPVKAEKKDKTKSPKK
jgi:hypothetical protein